MAEDIQKMAASESAGAQAPTWSKLLIGGIASRSVILAIGALLLVLYFNVESDGGFLRSSNIALLLRQAAVVSVAACGVALLIIMGEIDLSIGSAAFLTGLIVAESQVRGLGVVGSVGMGISAGVVIGLAQGWVISYLAVPAFVVTLGGMLLWRGLGLTWTNSGSIGPVDDNFVRLTEYSLPLPLVIALFFLAIGLGAYRAYSAFSVPGRDRGKTMRNAAAALMGSAIAGFLILYLGSTATGLPAAVLWIVAVSGALSFTLARVKFGRRAFLLGSSYEAAVYAGINAKRTVLTGFIIMGAIYGVAGVMTTARVGVSTPDASFGLELSAIAAAVIGGNSLRGGIGSMLGAVLGAFLLATIDNGMALLNVSTYAQNVAQALILIVAVGVDGFLRRRQISR